MAPTFFNILNFTLTTGQFSHMNLVMDLLGESIWFFFFATAQSLLWIVPVFFQIFLGPLSYPMMALDWWIELLWLLFVHPHPSPSLSDRKQGRLVNQLRKSVPRSIRQIFLSKNKVPIYSYAAQLNIFTSYWLTGWYASVLCRQIFDNYGVDSLGVMEKISWHTHLIFLIP